MKRNYIFNLIGVGLVVIGSGLLLFASHVRETNASIQASPAFTAENSVQPVIQDPQTISGKPVAIAVPALGIRNAVVDGVFDAKNGNWTLTRDKVQYALMTYQPNDSTGLTFMYGHNRREVFSKLPSVVPGMVAEVTTDNGYLFRYKFVSSKTVKPEDISVFEYSGDPILVLQTCTGVLYQNRQLFTFELVGVDRV